MTSTMTEATRTTSTPRKSRSTTARQAVDMSPVRPVGWANPYTLIDMTSMPVDRSVLLSALAERTMGALMMACQLIGVEPSKGTSKMEKQLTTWLKDHPNGATDPQVVIERVQTLGESIMDWACPAQMVKGKKRTTTGTTSGTATHNTKEYGVARAKDVPWCAAKVAVFTALIKLGAVSSESAVPSRFVAGLVHTSRPATHVRHYTYHGQVAGLTGVRQDVGAAIVSNGGYLYWITPAGAEALRAHLGT